MTETATPPTGSAPDAAPNVTQRVLAQYIRDLSFENLTAEKSLTSDPQQGISLQVDLESRKSGADNQHEVITKLSVTNKSKSSGNSLFRLEVEYAGIFEIDGLTDEQLESYLFTECPRITFPFLRRIVAGVTEEGGFPPLIIDTIDFVSLYRKQLNRRTQSNLAEAEQPQKPDS